MASDQALRDLILASNPVGYYPLDTLASLGADISPYANHGSQSGSFRQDGTTISGMDFVMTKGVSSPLVVIPDRAEYKGRTFTMECLIALSEDANMVIAERGGDNKNWSLQSIGSAFGFPAPSVQFILGEFTVDTVQGRAGPLLSLCHMVVTSVLGVTKIYVNGQILKEATGASGNGTQSNQGTLPIHLFSRGGNYATLAYLAHVAFYNRELSAAERQARSDLLNKPYEFKANPITAIVANQETRAQFQPQDVGGGGSQGAGWAGPVSTVAVTTDPLCKGQDLAWIRDGNQNVLQGYIAGVVTIKGVPVSRRVVCLDTQFLPVAEVWSDASGNYRFDLLWLNRTYFVVAIDRYEDHKYNPAAIDMKVPEPYV